MKLGEIKIDVTRLEEGAWVENIPEMGNLRLKVRGINNADWRRLQAKLSEAVPRKKRPGGRIDQDEQDAITSKCLQNACLLDWDGLEGDNGEMVPYSKELATDLLTKPEYRRFRDSVVWAASLVSEMEAADTEEASKNS